ncbi:hypothetical protein OIU84_029293 [Salix udensis]|uniref:Uncharacterized protein n=1 Tax=Salix udensis TaxID=889485 RepID=A0AAD6K8U9_9ROSI|nr:hypothetical protein OIU84_029293 [Salix udensis]
MADSDHSSSDGLSVDSRDTSQDSKLEFSEDEETLIIRMYNLVGERWTLIAGRIPGRTAEEIEKYWTSRYSTRTAIWGFSPDQNICTMVFQSDTLLPVLRVYISNGGEMELSIHGIRMKISKNRCYLFQDP